MRLNDLDFHVEVEGSGSPLLLLHGFTGSVRAWDDVRPALASWRTVISIDLIGHGRSATPADWRRYSLDWSARDLSALFDALGLKDSAVLGYSMGGRVALHFAMQAPERISSLILESASPGIEGDHERHERVRSDAALAERIERDGLASFVAEWERMALLAHPAHVSAETRARQHAQRLENNPLGLANSLRGMGAGQQSALWSRLPTLRKHVLLLAGEQDQRYRGIAERIHALVPGSELAIVAGAGHTIHVDQPEEFVTLVSQKLAKKP